LSAFVTFLFLAYRLFYEGRAVGAPKKKKKSFVNHSPRNQF